MNEVVKMDFGVNGYRGRRSGQKLSPACGAHFRRSLRTVRSISIN